MLEQASDGLPRIALVYGQAAAVEHVRDAVAGQVEVAYAAAAGEFDVQRMTAAHATTALVNLDDGDWLDRVEASLEQAGVAVVYNDPEISRGLDGWERARWLRHLVAKLSGSREVDPPRPAATEPPVAAGTDGAGDALSATLVEAAPESSPVVVPSAAAVAELPLSSEEIESMTVALAAGQDTANTLSPPADGAAIALPSSADLMDMDRAVDEAVASATSMRPNAFAQADAEPAASPDAGFDSDGGLDVDTEALSAMIDARLAESTAAMPSDSPQVWRVVEGGATSPVQLGDAQAPTAAASVASSPAATPVVEPAVQDDADVLASLPSLDDWALVESDAPVAKSAPADVKAPELSLLGSLAGLELVPMETAAPVRTHTDPIERWLHDSAPAKPLADGEAKSGTGGEPS